MELRNLESATESHTSLYYTDAVPNQPPLCADDFILLLLQSWQQT